jgi:signal transduction histidine kinase
VENQIRFEHWRPFNDKALQLCKSSEALNRYFSLNTTPPPEVMKRYMERFRELLEIVNDTRNKCAAIMEFLDHDFNNYLTPLSVLLKAMEKGGGSERNLRLIRQNLYINRVIRHIIGSVGFYVDGKLEAKPLSLTDFLISEKAALEKAFGRENKIHFNLEHEYVVNVNEDTLANMLLNMAKNARRHGEATELDIAATDDDKFVHLMISDNGMGIDPLTGEENEDGTVTDIMKRRVSRHGGQGLGLADLRERAKAMGCEVTCYGHGGLLNEQLQVQGAQFWFCLPMIKQNKPVSNFPPSVPHLTS